MIIRGKFEYNDDEGEGFKGLYCQICDQEIGYDSCPNPECKEKEWWARLEIKVTNDEVMPAPTPCVNCKQMVAYDEDHECEEYPDDSESVTSPY